MDVRYHDILRLTEDQEDALGVRFALFNELLRTSDIVTLHVPLNDITRKMMSTAQFAMMKRTAVLINTCRGPWSTRMRSTRRSRRERSPGPAST